MMSWWLILGWGIIEEIMWYCKPSHKSECTQPLVSPKATQRTKFQHLGVYKTNEPGPRIGSQNRWNMCEQIGISPSEMGVINLQNICMGNNWGFAEDSIRILIDSPCFGLFQCANWYQPVPTFLKSSFNVSRGPWSISTQTWQWKHRTSTFHNDVPECWDIPLPQWLFSRGFQDVSCGVTWTWHAAWRGARGNVILVKNIPLGLESRDWGCGNRKCAPAPATTSGPWALWALDFHATFLWVELANPQTFSDYLMLETLSFLHHSPVILMKIAILCNFWETPMVWRFETKPS